MLRLTRKEYDVLRVLVLSTGRPVTHEKLIQEVWGTPNDTKQASLRTMIKQLRHKLGEDLTKPKYILTEVGIGYWLNVNSS
jgi:two-component system KDP operon response regulator KdpE